MERLFSSRSKLAISLIDQETYVMVPEDNKLDMEILYKWNGNWLEQKKWSTLKVFSFVPENVRLICVYHLYFNL